MGVWGVTHSFLDETGTDHSKLGAGADATKLKDPARHGHERSQIPNVTCEAYTAQKDASSYLKIDSGSVWKKTNLDARTRDR